MSHWYYITPEEYEIAERNGISKKTLEARIRDYAWSKERALSEPVQEQGNLEDWYKIAKQNGIKYSTFTSRIYRGMTPEEAATTPIRDMREVIKRANKARRTYDPEIIELAKKNGISYRTFISRVKIRGWAEKAAATHPVMKKS